MSLRMTHVWLSVIVLAGACGLLLLLWLPSIHYPIVSDSARYALLSESLWKSGTYSLFGEPYAKHLPFHPFFSYLFIQLLGAGIGMKASSLFAGWLVLISTFFLLKSEFSLPVALGGVLAVVLNHGFILMTTLGSADLLFTALLIASVASYVRADEDEKWYLPAYCFLGLSCLTRYNGAPLFALYGFHTIFFRPEHRLSLWSWISFIIGSGIFGMWFVRNGIVFGDPFYTDYTSELSEKAPSLLHQFASNAWYYLLPQHNVLPVFLIFALYGLWMHRRTHGFLICVMVCALVLTAVWWVQALRFAFPAFPILLGFSIAGIEAFIERFREQKYLLIGPIVFSVLITHIPAICLYAYGSCNSYFDRTIGGIPANLGLSSEGFYTWDLARRYINEHADEKAAVFVPNEENKVIWRKEQVFREDLFLTDDSEGSCVVYYITQEPSPSDTVLFQTQDAPVTSVVESRCK